jgi:hypothetical protein
MDKYEFRSHNVSDHFVRHRSFQGELTRKDGAAEDFSFMLVRRGEHQVAIRSVNFPDRYLRHRQFRVWLEGGTDQLFQQDSTFFFERGLADPEGVSFRSVNYPDRYIRHRDFHLWVEAPADSADEAFRNDATFHRQLASVRID